MKQVWREQLGSGLKDTSCSCFKKPKWIRERERESAASQCAQCRKDWKVVAHPPCFHAPSSSAAAAAGWQRRRGRLGRGAARLPAQLRPPVAAADALLCSATRRKRCHMCDRVRVADRALALFSCRRRLFSTWLRADDGDDHLPFCTRQDIFASSSSCSAAVHYMEAHFRQ